MALRDRLKKFFGFSVNKNADNIIDKIQLYKTIKVIDKDGNESKKIEKEKFPDNVQALWNFWMQGCHDGLESWQNMQNVYEDQDMLYYNCGIISKATEIIIDEILQADSNNQTIFVEGKQKIRKYIEKFFLDINLYELLRPTVRDIVRYGNAGWVLGFDDRGVNEVVQVNPRFIKQRMEFSPYELNAQINNSDKFFKSYTSSVSRIQDLIDMILNTENASSYFKKYLIGYEIEDSVLPPWKFIHFRNYTNDSPFKPFGVPAYIHAVSPYRQYDAAMALQITARGIAFPKEIYKIKLPNVISPTEKLAKATEFMNELLNNGFGSSKKELPGIGDIIITIDELYDFDVKAVEMDLGNTNDLEILRDELLDSSLLPRKLIDPRDSGFGESGVAFREQFKPFARLIYRYQSILLQNITQLVKIHLIHTGEFDIDEIEFGLTMPYPESQTNADIISSQQSLLSLSNDIIGAIEDKITGGEKLPPELVKQIYTKFLPYDSSIIDSWVDEALKSYESDDTTPTKDSRIDDLYGDDDLDFDTSGDIVEPEEPKSSEQSVEIDDTIEVSDDEIEDELANIFSSVGLEENRNKRRKKWKILEKNVGKKELKEMVNEIIFEEQHKIMIDMNYKNKHYYSSKNKMLEFDIFKFSEFSEKKQNKRLAESKIGRNKERYNQYEEYKIKLKDSQYDNEEKE